MYFNISNNQNKRYFKLGVCLIFNKRYMARSFMVFLKITPYTIPQHSQISELFYKN